MHRDLMETALLLDPKGLIERITSEVGGPGLAELDAFHRALVIERSGLLVAAAFREFSVALAAVDQDVSAVVAAVADRVQAAAESYGEDDAGGAHTVPGSCILTASSRK